MKILVADDSKTTLTILTKALENMGHEVIGVPSGKMAIQAFQDSKPDLIILDVVMDEIDGFECAKKNSRY